MQKKKDALRTPAASRPGLSIEVIVETACELIAESGADQLTMRRLSERLGVALGATYHYVPNRDGLLKLVAERIMTTIELLSTTPKSWQPTLRTLMIDFAAAFTRYPGMARYHLANVEATGPVNTQATIMQMLADAGFSTDSSLTLIAALFFYTSGVTATGIMTHDQPGLTTSMVAQRFEAGLDLLLEGAAAQLRADKKARRAEA
ncbi:MAG: TetR family transcriptional regulator [Actinobacteria bacterium]|jgi:AcrR family transcriptional regulator|uniref:Unannotated protein n=1 Tax=freshwater metagenome TaxID=449393 RepID=A0A6J7C3B3_9ZZZZ|nr:TetR family transcriptional regulator [Actinomycetota bacterium]MSW76351.1 TetR family transcriptional regulator [Actinomycetota bacterium]MSX55027.1 TetR family transcriptional regulator [Actinomycetota bacterium]MSX92497.1 TetR family transcriptional regulator [Actinomycetota bacterium]MSZ83974.1 TetR family transcriptional regulator [Actinomycetota bacterium]